MTKPSGEDCEAKRYFTGLRRDRGWRLLKGTGAAATQPISSLEKRRYGQTVMTKLSSEMGRDQPTSDCGSLVFVIFQNRKPMDFLVARVQRIEH